MNWKKLSEQWSEKDKDYKTGVFSPKELAIFDAVAALCSIAASLESDKNEYDMSVSVPESITRDLLDDLCKKHDALLHYIKRQLRFLPSLIFPSAERIVIQNWKDETLLEIERRYDDNSTTNDNPGSNTPG